ncbi:MAG: OmpA family protein [Chloroflexi bacterium]|nr:OmpA family protein [Chloroflexota bacterium]
MSQQQHQRLRVREPAPASQHQSMPVHDASEPETIRDHPLKTLASRLGNQRFRRIIAREPLPGGPSPVPIPLPTTIDDTANPKRETLLGKPLYSDTYDFTTSWGKASKFDVVYEPTGDGSPAPASGPVHGSTNITLKIFLNFIPFNLARVKKEDRKYKGYDASKVDPNWPEGEPEKFREAFATKTSSAWTEKHDLTCAEVGMEDITTDMKVQVMTVDDEKLAHYKFDVMWLPEDAPKFRSNAGFLGSRDNEDEATDHGLAMDVFGSIEPFGFDDYSMKPPLEDQADEFLDEIDDVRKEKEADPTLEEPKMMVTLTGFASSQGDPIYNEKLSEDRAKSVKTYMSGKAGLAESDFIDLGLGEQGTGTKESYRRVVVRAYDEKNPEPVKSTHNTSAHEVGHVFGLEDEYVDDDEHRTVGEKPEHHDEVGDELGDEAADETIVGAHEESIMAGGGEVLPAHYTYFIKALESVSGVQWTIK